MGFCNSLHADLHNEKKGHLVQPDGSRKLAHKEIEAAGLCSYCPIGSATKKCTTASNLYTAIATSDFTYLLFPFKSHLGW